MTEPRTGTPAPSSYAEVEAALLGRWPESRLEPSLDRILALTELLGDPQRAYPVIHLTGTNGKTSTSSSRGSSSSTSASVKSAPCSSTIATVVRTEVNLASPLRWPGD